MKNFVPRRSSLEHKPKEAIRKTTNANVDLFFLILKLIPNSIIPSPALLLVQRHKTNRILLSDQTNLLILSLDRVMCHESLIRHILHPLRPNRSVLIKIPSFGLLIHTDETTCCFLEH